MVEGWDQVEALGCGHRLSSRSLLRRANSAGKNDLSTHPPYRLDLDSCRCFRHYDYGANSERPRGPRNRKAVVSARGRDNSALAPIAQPGDGSVRSAELEGP